MASAKDMLEMFLILEREELGKEKYPMKSFHFGTEPCNACIN